MREDKRRETYQEILDCVEAAFEESGLNVTELSRTCETSISQISNIRQRNALPALTTAVKIAQGLNKSLDWIFNPYYVKNEKEEELTQLFRALNKLEQEDVLLFAKYRKRSKTHRSNASTQTLLVGIMDKVKELSNLSQLDIIQFIEYRIYLEQTGEPQTNETEAKD